MFFGRSERHIKNFVVGFCMMVNPSLLYDSEDFDRAIASESDLNSRLTPLGSPHSDLNLQPNVALDDLKYRPRACIISGWGRSALMDNVKQLTVEI